MQRIARITAASLGLVMLAACSPPKPPEEERRPEPQASAAELPRDGSKPTIIQQTYGPALEKAKAVEGQTLDAARQQQAAIDAQAQ